MRLISARLRSYRIHRDSGTIVFDRRRTVISGPNEAGKSTLAEAVHRALFLKAKGDTADHRAMQPALGGVPEVDLTFEARGKVWELRKRFARNGTTSLTTDGAAALSGEAAESELADLLGVEGGLSGKAALGQWPHLWVWQGESGNDPSPHATSQHAGLLRRLQDSGGAAAMQSERDSRLAARFAAASGTIFTLAGNPRTDSELARATAALTEAGARQAAAAGKLEANLRTVRDFESATATLAELGVSLETLRRQHRDVSARQEKITALRQRETAGQGRAETAALRLTALETAEQRILRLRDSIQALETALAPDHAGALALTLAGDQAAAHSAAAATAHESAERARETARQRRDLAVAWVARFEAGARLDELSAGMARVEELNAELAALRRQSAELPNVDAAGLQRIQQLETAQSSARAALQAMATRLEVVSADQAVEVGGARMTAGMHQVLTEDTEILYGADLKLRLRPGGGTGLDEARRKCGAADAALREALGACGLATGGEAALAVARRTDLAARIRAVEAGLESMARSVSAKALAAAGEAHIAARADVSRRSGQLPDFAAPGSPEEATALARTAARQLEDAESAAQSARAVRDAASRALAEAVKTLEARTRTMQARNREISDLQAQLRLLLDQHGADEPRALALARSREESRAAAESLTACRSELADLQPHLAAGDLERLSRALDQSTARKNEAEIRRAVARDSLRSDGAEDPEAELALAAAQAAAAAEHLIPVRRQAQAVRLLDELFTAEQRALADQFTRPLADRISGYLECLFGPGGRASMMLEDNRFTGLRLAARPGQDTGFLSFSALSGGTREQLAAAVRLAVAEILAADHDGCLPVVFDDAFTNSDPERLLTLQRMLDLAAGRGLQIVVLTCHPAAYAGLGAAAVTLSRGTDGPAAESGEV
ncbi:MAG: AAA family ATPase [Verrucomicrobiota bacterium]